MIAVSERLSRCPHPRSAHRAGRVRLSDLLGNDCGVLTDTNQQRDFRFRMKSRYPHQFEGRSAMFIRLPMT
jgi:hypothetical protein